MDRNLRFAHDLAWSGAPLPLAGAEQGSWLELRALGIAIKEEKVWEFISLALVSLHDDTEQMRSWPLHHMPNWALGQAES